MTFFRQYIIPFLILAMFLLALTAVSSRAFLPSDMAAPAPVTGNEEISFLGIQVFSNHRVSIGQINCG
ncbi:conserved hypothetical protein [Hyella patelloides LEGE 07179]|uniref:Uncharacterized protein n=1 Tax=Hyella patelloides LEGE 07179 TaxID=945734 RepID=A0A563VKH0_9CYAN|nr:hypothetical protein [Hyella patelloides]VEP11960.1 conserved hypothetical protein [Hyella patelloides LEGE 07179]